MPRIMCAPVEKGRAVSVDRPPASGRTSMLPRPDILPGSRLELDRLLAVRGLADHVEVVSGEQGRQGLPGQGVVVDDEHARLHRGLIGRSPAAD